MRTRIWLVVLLWLLPIPLAAAEPDPLAAIARRVARQIAEKPEVSAAMYGPAFLHLVPTAKLAAICKELFEKNGKVLVVEKQPGATATSGKFTFRCRETQMTVSLVIEADAPHRIMSLWFGPPAPIVASWDDLTARLAKLPGEVSFQVERLDDGKILASHQADKPLGIGSAFKLYLLAALIDRRTPWDKIVKIEDRYKSLPSGQLQNWPAGSPVTVHTLAVQMISISDNTAADHLLALIGREEVEKRLGRFGMKAPARNIPFLATREFFRLKSDAALRKAYLAASPASRRKILDRVAAMPALKDSDENWSGPLAIDRIEWFASAADLCRVLGWLDEHGGPSGEAILAVNPGRVFSKEPFTYVGYKGGSEAGVLSMNWLLHARDGRHYALSAIWNDPRSDVDLPRLAGLLSAAAALSVKPAKR